MKRAQPVKLYIHYRQFYRNIFAPFAHCKGCPSAVNNSPGLFGIEGLYIQSDHDRIAHIKVKTGTYWTNVPTGTYCTNVPTLATLHIQPTIAEGEDTRPRPMRSRSRSPQISRNALTCRCLPPKMIGQGHTLPA
jgi:hypothetical protein